LNYFEFGEPVQSEIVTLIRSSDGIPSAGSYDFIADIGYYQGDDIMVVMWKSVYNLLKITFPAESPDLLCSDPQIFNNYTISQPSLTPDVPVENVGLIAVWTDMRNGQGGESSIRYKYVYTAQNETGIEVCVSELNGSSEPDIAISPDRILFLAWQADGPFNESYAVFYENNYGDFDADGMNDAWEDYYGFSRYNPDDALMDTDNDGLINLYEYKYGMPTDWDALPLPLWDDLSVFVEYNVNYTDIWNIYTSLDANEWAAILEQYQAYYFGDLQADPSDVEDYYSLYHVYWNGTDPTLKDSDGDGLWDGVNPATGGGEDVNCNGNFGENVFEIWTP
jgi:hypothetical protein